MVRLSVVTLTASLLAIVCSTAGCGAGYARASAARCPDLTRDDELAATDFREIYGLTPVEAARIKAVVLVASEVNRLADRLDADLGIACAQLANDLGKQGDWRTGHDACEAAIEALESIRGKLGPKASVRLVSPEPLCLSDPAFVTKCASMCEVSASSDQTRAECTQKAGRCDGTCDGACEFKAPSKCGSGSRCSGTCEGSMKGTCGGRCVGTCDGRRVIGPCAGVCTGKCERGPMVGTCGGACTGRCKFSKPSVCDGTCIGACSTEPSGVMCVDAPRFPAIGQACRTRCAFSRMSRTECTSGQVGLVLIGAKDRKAGDTFKAALERSLPTVIKVLGELGAEAGQSIEEGKILLETERTSFETKLQDGSARGGERKLAECLLEPLTSASAKVRAIESARTQLRRIRDDFAHDAEGSR
jgi:hypothetical protein